MSRSRIFRSGLGALSPFGIVALAACSSSETRTLGEVIEMGPWAFEVERVQEASRTRPSLGRLMTVTVTIRLHNFTEQLATPFGDFINGYDWGTTTISPHVELEHSDGATFAVVLYPTGRGDRRSERWRAEVDLIPTNAGAMADSGELAERYADTPLSALTLSIENPDRRSGQRARVLVALE
ncbi:MAG: hypothetical protein WEG36_03610 [Gemmatimonadota bacterium]